MRHNKITKLKIDIPQNRYPSKDAVRLPHGTLQIQAPNLKSTKNYISP